MNNIEKLKELMESKGLTQNAFAKEVGVAQSQISYVLNGKISFTENIVTKICKRFNLDKNYFNEDEIIEEKKELVCTLQDVLNPITKEDEDLYDDILENAKKITKIRFDLLNIIKKEREQNKEFNFIDQDFLHKIENLENITDEEATEIIIKERHTRKKRRVNKNRIFLVQSLLNNLPLVDYYNFTVNGIEQGKNYKYSVKAQEKEQ